MLGFLTDFYTFMKPIVPLSREISVFLCTKINRIWDYSLYSTKFVCFASFKGNANELF